MRPPACRRSSSRRRCGRRRVGGAKKGKKRNLTRGGMIRRVNLTLEPTTTGLKVQRSNQLSYLCLESGSRRILPSRDNWFSSVRLSRTRTLRMLIFSASEKPGGSRKLRVVGEDPQRADAEPTVGRRCVVFRQAHQNLGGNGTRSGALLRASQAVLVARRRRRQGRHAWRTT